MSSNKCGNCNACCVYFSIEDPPNEKTGFLGIKKKVKEVCSNYKNNSCVIYNNRGAICNNYRCLWHWGFLPDWMKPDQISIVFDRFWISSDKIYIVGRTAGEITKDIENTIKRVCKMGMPVQLITIGSYIEGVRKKTLYDPTCDCNQCKTRQQDMQEKMRIAAQQTGSIVDNMGNIIKRELQKFSFLGSTSLDTISSQDRQQFS